ncbi:hypothetical protein N7519_006128 [Penicillium mononematosum]|uniref:uncharacterized protein n=1 Tax=Penicillium mononematosum TaxID=268346 RepID=UPI002549645A|nr:uncharacterized protein N7519_006128 [Penicillium mononematosum]KAJ6184827.1 hypothetical protein N7519_006128 [Penicillium mononematosum]
MHPTTPKPVRARRTHCKSRLGCASCKRRRIKCDERRPICSNCVHHKIDCTFATEVVAEPTSLSERATEQRRARRSRTHQNSTYKWKHTFVSPNNSDETRSSTDSTGTKYDASTVPPTTISLADLQLFHYFITTTYQAMAVEGGQDLWQVDLVQWGFEFPSILHLVLALAALHAAYEKPELRDQFVQQANDHFTFGIRSVTGILSQLNDENCQKIYMSASLICLIYFGRGPCPGEYLIFSTSGPSEWLILMRGVKFIMANYRDKVFTGTLEPKGGSDEPDFAMTPEMCSESSEHTMYTEAVQRLVEQEEKDESDRAMYISAIKDLLGIIREVYRKVSAGKTGLHLMHLLIGWLYRQPEEFVSIMEQQEPHALIIVASWGVLLKYMESSWLMKGWSKHVVLGGFCNSSSRSSAVD